MNTHWSLDDVTGKYGLSDHPLYFAAKENRDTFAAVSILNEIVTQETIDKIADCIFYKDHTTHGLSVIAPAATPDESNNALAITYAQWLARELDLHVEKSVFVSRVVRRDRQGAWFRLAHHLGFYGTVTEGRSYIIVDDVMTLGGTLADLRGFIESKGGYVICMSVLAHRNGRDLPICLAGPTLYRLFDSFGEEIDEYCKQELGHGADCLTEPEAQLLLGCPSLDAVRAAIHGARHTPNPRAGRSRGTRKPAKIPGQVADPRGGRRG